MSEFLSPGVFIEEAATDLQTVQAVSTSNCGFVGFTPRGPSGPTLVTSFPEATRKFGKVNRKSILLHSLAGFFQNGGARAYLSRVVPSDAVTANAKIRSLTDSQVIEQGVTGQATFTRTAGSSPLKDNAGVSPLVPSAFSARWRALGAGTVAAQITRTRGGTTGLVCAAGQALYEGRLDPKATRTIAGSGANGSVVYRSLLDANTAIEVQHQNLGISQTLTVLVSGNRITVNLGTDGSGVITSTAANVAAAVTASVAASALLTATPTGDGTGLAGVSEVRALQGIPALDPALFALLPGSLVLTWSAGGTPTSVDFTGQTTTPVQTATTVAGSRATVDLRTGRFSLECVGAEIPASGPDVGVSITAAFTPASASLSIADNGGGALVNTAVLSTPGTIGYADGSYSFTALTPAVATAAIGAGGNGTVTTSVDLQGPLGNQYTIQVFLPAGTAALSAKLVGTAIQVNLAVTSGVATAGANTATLIAAAITALPGVSAVASGTGASEITTASGPTAFTGGRNDARPINLGDVLATYSINAWELTCQYAGADGNNLRTLVSGDASYYDTATASYSRFLVTVQQYDADLGAWATVESWDELVFDDAESPQFWADVVNDLSDYIQVGEPGANEAPGTLTGLARNVVLAVGDESSLGQVLSGTLPNGPIAGRSIVITYTDLTGVERTVTDNGFGVMGGSVDSTYVSVVGGVAANRVNMTTGAFNVKLLYGIRRGTVVEVDYRSMPAATTHTERLGDTDRGYTAGTDGTFDSDHYGRNQISEPLTLGPVNRGLYALSLVDEIMQVVIPDFAGDVPISQDLVDYAEERAASNPSGGDRFIILSTPRGLDKQEAVDWLVNQLGRQSKYAACYWPQIRIRDPLANNRLLTIPAVGHIAGIYARTDANRNVGKVPAGTVDGAFVGVAELEYKPSQGDRDYVYPNRLNPLRDDAQVGRCVWGCRTTSLQSAWRYINATRLFQFCEKSVFNSTHWIVFENNGTGLWGRIALQLEGFFGNLFTEGYFAGATRAQAYSIVVDNTNNTSASVNAGQVLTDIGIAPNKPAEFVRFRFAQRSLTV